MGNLIIGRALTGQKLEKCIRLVINVAVRRVCIWCSRYFIPG